MKPAQRHKLVPKLAALAAAAAAACSANAFEIDTGNPDLKLRWDNTVKYSNAFRVKDRAPELASDPGTSNLNDGNNNFGKGLVSNRFDLLSELDLQMNGTIGLASEWRSLVRLGLPSRQRQPQRHIQPHARQ